MVLKSALRSGEDLRTKRGERGVSRTNVNPLFHSDVHYQLIIKRKEQGGDFKHQ